MLPTVQRRWSWCYSNFVWLCDFYYGTFYFESCLAFCSQVLFFFFFFFFAVLFSDVVTSLGKDRAGLFASRAFVSLFACVNFCHFSLRVGCGL